MKISRIKPQPGQESVWDYPRPPRVEAFKGHVRIQFNGQIILDSNRVYRNLETSHPPTYYIPMEDFQDKVLMPTPGTSFCEFKGVAHYLDIRSGDQVAQKAAWYYPEAKGQYLPLRNKVAVYAHMMDTCWINDEPVQAQEGDFYGGWITSNIVGPFKGGQGTWGW